MSVIPPHSSFGDPLGRLIVEGRLRPPTQPGGRPTLDRFEILDWLGEGGMGEVLLARDPTRGNETVAIKLLKTSLTKNTYAVRRFLREARLMERLAHPAIVPVLEVLDGREGPSFAMPLFKAGSAATLLREGCPLEPARILAMARPIAEALHHAHNKGVIHRDLKPANLLLREDGSAALGDFGLARTTFNDSMLDVEHSHRSGTAPYLAPEVAQGEAGDTRVDIYSFGAVLYELLTGRPPYDGASTQEILQKIKHAAPPPIRELQPKAPAPLVAIAEGAMARSVRDRYASMADVAADLERVGRGLSPHGPHGRAAWNLASRLKPVAATLAVASAIATVWLLRPTTEPKEVLSLETEPKEVLSPELVPKDILSLETGLKEVHSFSLQPIRPGVFPRVGSWGPGGKPNIFVTGKDELLIYSTSGEPLSSYTLEQTGAREFVVNLFADVWAPPPATEDGRAEVVLSWTHQITNLHLLVLNQNHKPWKRFQAVGTPPTERDGGIDGSGMQARMVSDLNGDGRRELLASLNTGYALKPRGLICFDFESQTQLWQRLIAPSPQESALIDLEHDGTIEVVLGSDAVCNTNSLADGTDDFHSYLYAFSHTGLPLWTIPLGDRHSRTHPLVSDLNGDGRDDLAAWVEAKAEFRTNEVGRILRFDGAGKEARSYDAGACLLSCAVGDLNGDGQSEIIATDVRGAVHVLNNRLESLRHVQLAPPREDLDGELQRHSFVDLKLVAVTNLDATAEPELVFTSQYMHYVSGMNPGSPNREPNVRRAYDVSVYVLDANLQMLAIHKVAELREEPEVLSVAVADVDGDGIPELIVFAKDRVTVLKLRRARE